MKDKNGQTWIPGFLVAMNQLYANQQGFVKTYMEVKTNSKEYAPYQKSRGNDAYLEIGEFLYKTYVRIDDNSYPE